MSRPAATIIKRCCKAEGAVTQQCTYTFTRVYLCDAHRELWDLADIAAHRGGRCPHAPKPCERCGGGKP